MRRREHQAPLEIEKHSRLFQHLQCPSIIAISALVVFFPLSRK